MDVSTNILRRAFATIIAAVAMTAAVAAVPRAATATASTIHRVSWTTQTLTAGSSVPLDNLITTSTPGKRS